MYARLLKKPFQGNHSFFLFGPRGTGKTTLIRRNVPDALYIDLLDSGTYTSFLAAPERLEKRIPPAFDNWVVIDEVQRVPQLLNEVHRLIEGKGLRFILTGSSARGLRKKGVNLLAGRAYTYRLHPLTAEELGPDYNITEALRFGLLPSVWNEEVDRKKYLESYVRTYLEQEILFEGFARSLGAFTRFLETASFSQGSILNISNVAGDAGIERRTVNNYFDLLEDMLIGVRLYPFTKKTKRRLTLHPKFYYFDTGVYRSLRPRGPLDSPDEQGGLGLESLVFQELRAALDYHGGDETLHYWRTASGLEVDFVVYGPDCFCGIEVKQSAKVRPADLSGLRAFARDYPEARLLIFYGGREREYHEGIDVIPVEEALKGLSGVLYGTGG
jgi:predicted AAA+ superfamily ATPase